MIFKEFEYKYYAQDIKLKDFIALMNKLGYNERLDISSWDTYYVKPGNNEEFQRYRQSNNPELTKKKKTQEANNWHREEIDLPLDSNKTNEKLVEAYVAMDGYEKNFSIYKSCFIFWKDYVNYVYYITYNENMQELNRFIEVEINKSKIDELLSERDKEIGSFDGVVQALNIAALELKELGLIPQNRLKKSLFELYLK